MNSTDTMMILKTRFDEGGAASAATAYIGVWEDGKATVDVDWTTYWGTGESVYDLYFDSVPTEAEIVKAVLDELERRWDAAHD